MSNTSNYIQDTENVQYFSQSSIKNKLKWEPVKRIMTYQDFVITFDKTERIKHCNFIEIDTNTGHTHAIGKSSGKGSHKDTAGQILDVRSQSYYAIKNLKQFILNEYNIELIGQQTHSIHLCHLCDHNCQINKKDSTKHTCTKPQHVYFGTASENDNDIKPEIKKQVRSKGGQKGHQSQIITGTHSSQIRDKCPYCELETTKYTLTGVHIPACHFNPNSRNYLKSLLSRYAIKLYQQQGLSYKLIELQLMINQTYNLKHD